MRRKGIVCFESVSFFCLNFTINNYGLYQIASESVKEKIRQIVQSENPESPLSDQEIADILRKDDVIELQKQNPPFGGLLAVPISDLQRVFQSPGPINEPGVKMADSGRWLSALQATGFAPGDVIINTFFF